MYREQTLPDTIYSFDGNGTAVLYTPGMSDTGLTLSEDPITISRSH